MDPVVAAVLQAAAGGDWARFRELVLPYVHWTEGLRPDGQTS